MNRFAIKKLSLLFCLLALAASDLCAQRIIKHQLPVTQLQLRHENNLMLLDMNLDAAKFKASKDREYVITPTLVAANGIDSVEFEPVIITGRNLYYRHLRNGDLEASDMVRSGKKLIPYSQVIERQPWMDDATLHINTVRRGCCDGITGSYSDPIARIRRVTYTPVFNFIQPVADSIKTYELSGSSFINFPVNRTELYPTYMDNPVELARITGTIDSVKGDPDITITSIFIKGFASPEGPYDNNVRLAKGRTATLKDYVEKLYKFPANFIKTDFMPENWPGLRDYVVSSSLANRDGILAIIDSDIPFDARDNKIKTTYPTEYDFLLHSVYPRLRRSDYVITYTVRSYTSLEDILRVLKTAPQKLSKEEFYRAAQSMRQGSDEYNEVFETAVRMYPNDAVCNLNAANSAMQAGRYDKAAAYLAKAGDDPSAIYARGVLAALQKNYAEAENYFAQTARLKVADAPAALEAVREAMKYADGRVEILDN